MSYILIGSVIRVCSGYCPVAGGVSEQIARMVLGNPWSINLLEREMHVATKACRSILAGAALAVTLPVYAAPIPVGNDLIINFDFSFQSPAPPYDQVRGQFSYVISVAGTLHFDYFRELYGAGGAGLSFDVPYPAVSDTTFFDFVSPTSDWATDGQFSVGLRMVSGEGNLVDDSAVATGINNGQIVANINGSVVPEPATLALIGLGLAGVAATRKRKQ